MEPTTSWFLVGFVNHCTTTGTLLFFSFFFDDEKHLAHEFKKQHDGSSHCGAAEMNLASIHEDVGSIPGLTQWVNDPAFP